jgi:hypothetical protein
VLSSTGGIDLGKEQQRNEVTKFKKLVIHNSCLEKLEARNNI